MKINMERDGWGSKICGTGIVIGKDRASSAGKLFGSQFSTCISETCAREHED
jgi:hypothetical protein